MKDDTISRRAALDALGERPMLWVDDDNYTLGARNQYDSNRLAIETVPSVDAVPVTWIEGEIKWLKEMDNPFAIMSAGQIEAMLKRWKDGDENAADR